MKNENKKGGKNMYFISFITFGTKTEQFYMENKHIKVFSSMQDCAKTFAQLENCGHIPQIHLCRIN